MCACRQKKSFLIEDILFERQPNDDEATPKKAEETNNPINNDDRTIRFEVRCEVQNEMELNKLNLEQRRNTYPLHPTAVKPIWSYRKDYHACPFNYYSEPMLQSDQILRSQLASTWMPYNMRNYGVDRAQTAWCSPWWGVAGRRKGGQVRFTAAQTNALERRFGASIYLSPDERRALAVSLRLSDRQVKTWFQNRRAKWRRTTPDGGSNSPSTADESDDDVQMTDE